MAPLILFAAAAFSGCAYGPASMPSAAGTTPTGPCRDDESFINGRCEPRIPGDRQPPGGVPPWTRP